MLYKNKLKYTNKTVLKVIDSNLFIMVLEISSCKVPVGINTTLLSSHNQVLNEAGRPLLFCIRKRLKLNYL